MSASRPTALCRSLSDSGFGITTQDADSAYYNTPLMIRQNTLMLRDRLKHRREAFAYHSQFGAAEGDVSFLDSKACVMGHSLGVLDMFIDSISRELEVPLNSGDYYNAHPQMSPSYDSLTDVKSVVEYGEVHEEENTAVKTLHGENRSLDVECMNDAILRPPAYGDLSDDDVCHLIDSVKGLHRKLDILQSKMNNLLQQKSDSHISNENSQNSKPSSHSKHQFVTKKAIGFRASQDIGKSPRDSIYVQIEQVYYNLQKINFLYRAGNGFMTKYPPFSSTKVDKRDTAEATTQTKTDDATEITSLRKRCDRLEKKNASLKEELEKLQKSSAKKPPVPAPRQKKMSTASFDPEDWLRKAPEQDSMYTLVNCVVGPPTAPPMCPPFPKDICMTEVTCEWTITDYKRQLQEQRSGRMHSTISAPFFITHNGYCARLEAFLDGSGCAKGVYFSVFLRILPSEMDEQLLWPAHLKLTFILLNQSDSRDEDSKSRRTIVEHCFPRPNSSGMYQSGESDCWGVFNLASHETIHSQQFIREDKLLLQCRVHILSGWKRNRRGPR